MPGPQRDDIGRLALRQGWRCRAQRCRPRLACRVQQRPSRRTPLRSRHHVARPQRQPLGVLQLPQFHGRADGHIRVGAHAVAPARCQPGGAGEDAVAQIGLRHRAEASGRAARGQPFDLPGSHVGGVDQAPAPVHRRVVQQPFHRAGAAPGQAILHLAHLLGRMDVDRTLGLHGANGQQFLRRDGAQAVRGDADGHAVQAPRRLQQAGEAVQAGDESALAGGGRHAAEPAMGVKHGEQREPDARGLGGCGDAAAEFGRVGVRAPPRVVVQVVELAHPCEAAFQHFHEGLGRNGLHVVRVHPVEETVHHLTPRPEAVLRRAAGFGQAGQAALEGVAVQVGQARQRGSAANVARLRGGIPLDALDPPRLQMHPDSARPAIAQQRLVEEQRLHGGPSPVRRVI